VSPRLEVRAIKAGMAARTVIWTMTVLARLREGPATTSELYDTVSCASGAFRRQLYDLRRRGMITSTRRPMMSKNGYSRALWMLPG
jgi:DNA-binding HxlR family transcriptional regulator